MSDGVRYLHSHSWIERELSFPKHTVLIDEEYESLFSDIGIKTELFKYKGKNYYKVPVLAFIRRCGRFKNLKE